MPHFKIDPLKELESLSQRMRKFVDDFPDNVSIEFGGRFEPRTNIYSDETSLSVIMELPGVAKESIGIILENGILTIRGGKVDLVDKESTHCIRSERSFGEFSRSFDLPFAVDRESVKTSLADGLLTISFLKKTDKPDAGFAITIE
jgi:HSP20 family protein